MLLEFEFDIFYEQSQDQCDGQVARRAGGRMILDNFRETNVVLLSTYTINFKETT